MFLHPLSDVLAMLMFLIESMHHKHHRTVKSIIIIINPECSHVIMSLLLKQSNIHMHIVDYVCVLHPNQISRS